MLRITGATSLLGGPITATMPDGTTFTASPSALTISPADAFPAVADPRCGLPDLVEATQADPTISPCALGVPTPACRLGSSTQIPVFGIRNKFVPPQVEALLGRSTLIAWTLVSDSVAETDESVIRFPQSSAG